MTQSSFEARLRDILRLYEVLAELQTAVGGKRTLRRANGRMDWPKRGVYFFFEPGEERTTSGTGLRVVRVGTHALKARSRSTLWGRLRQHRGPVSGSNPGGGNHRGSVFRLHVGTALIGKGDWPDEVTRRWGVGSGGGSCVRERELPLERAVSEHIRRMPLLWVGVLDEPGPKSQRGHIERNAIALLSNCSSRREPIDPPSACWLGRWAASGKIRCSGLWNVAHVMKGYDPRFLDVLQGYVHGPRLQISSEK